MSFRLVAAALLSAQITLAANPVAARINGKPIFEEEVRGWMDREEQKGRPTTRSEALDRLILYRLSLEEARRRKLEKKPEVKEAVDRALYKSLLEDLKTKANDSFRPSKEELKALYEESPLVRVRHMVLITDSEEATKKAQAKLKEIQNAIAEGEDFKALVLKYSEDRSATLNGGDLDFRGRDSLEEPFYSMSLALKPNQVSAPIYHAGGVHILQLIERKPFEGAFAPYLSYLEERFHEEKEHAFLERALGTLKGKAKIEITGGSANP